MENDKLVQALMERVSDQMVTNLRETISEAIQREINKSLSKTMLEGEFYRRVNEDLQNSLKDIYREIKTAKEQGPVITIDQDAGELFDKASDQLDAVLQTTEKATNEIIETIENLQELQMSVANIVSKMESGGVTKQDREKLKDINDVLGNDLLSIMTTLSFQDLTGQRIKIIIDTIKKVEQIVLDVYMSTGLMIKAREEGPERDLDALKQEAENKASQLKGPSGDSNQNEVDDLLASLGL